MSTTISSIWGTAMARKPSLLKRQPRTLVYATPSYQEKPLPLVNEFLDTIVVNKNPRRKYDKLHKLHKLPRRAKSEAIAEPRHEATVARGGAIVDEGRDWLAWGDDVDDMIRWVHLWGTAAQRHEW